ncbi:MAG: ParB N-terminal domain-containing protein [Methylomicrobium sp.]|nr:ParB N-terminal domain-containing protein [Methylomicrobium sp.]
MKSKKQEITEQEHLALLHGDESIKEELVSIDAPIPYEFNSKVHSEEQIRRLMASISTEGLSNPILLDKDMMIIAGHGRLEACKRLGMKFVRVKIRSDLNEQAVKRLRIADNQTTSTEYDTDLLKLELEQIDLEGVFAESLGFDEKSLKKMISDFTEIDTDALSKNLDEDIDEQIKQGDYDIKIADDKKISVISALGFKSISVSAGKKVGRFIAGLQDEYELPPDEAFIRFVEDLEAQTL